MGILKRLFGKKKKVEKEEPAEPKKEQVQDTSRDVSLNEVKDELNNLETVEKDSDIENQTVESKTEKASVNEETKEAPHSKQDQSKPKTPPKQTESKDESTQEYHIKKHSEGWQIWPVGGKKALRVFSYQKEAIDYAKEQNLTYKVFKADGSPRQS